MNNDRIRGAEKEVKGLVKEGVPVFNFRALYPRATVGCAGDISATGGGATQRAYGKLYHRDQSMRFIDTRSVLFPSQPANLESRLRAQSGAMSPSPVHKQIVLVRRRLANRNRVWLACVPLNEAAIGAKKASSN